MSVSTGPTVDQSSDPDDRPSNPSHGRHFAEIVEARLSRRAVLAGGMFAAAGFLTTSLVGPPAAVAAPPGQGRNPGAGGAPLLGYEAIPLGYGDEVVVPRGYSAVPFIPWGTPILGSYPAFVPGSPDAGVAGGNTAEDQAEQIGMHHDGMHFFPIGKGSTRGLLVVNQEYTDEFYLHTGAYAEDYTEIGRDSYTAEMVRKSQNAHGVSVVEVKRAGQKWKVERSDLNRRITANTEMSVAGPAAGNELLRTAADAEGSTPLGTFNNCSHGVTPWDTYLTCEENFNGYFGIEGEREEGFELATAFEPEDAELLERYGVGGDRFNWGTQDSRFVVSRENPHEPNRFGWVVEIDPREPDSTPVKRTALGRLKHEGAFVQTAENGHVVVYMGDDQVDEYVYKFVSAGTWESVRESGTSPLDEGILYVAHFHDDGSGTWLPLVHGQGPLTGDNFADQGEVLVKTRLAADALGATPMDRPEWTTVDPTNGTVYLTLTNNSGRQTTNAANPRAENRWGQIVRWEEAGGDHTATTFTWDLFLLAGPPESGATIDGEDAFSSPDGLWADDDGRIWIQTDGTQPLEANDQMLAADPTTVDADGVPQIKRFLTGVIGCEVTGVITTPDQRTMFVNLQHPGEEGGSTWPHDDEFDTPRSATVVITKDDGGVIGT
jgi:secreted PhoX family phosphatase